jgi:hypothetical protein
MKDAISNAAAVAIFGFALFMTFGGDFLNGFVDLCYALGASRG